MKTKEQKNKREKKKEVKKKEFLVLALITLFLFLAVLNIKTASAIGITPGRTTIIFESGMERTVQFRVINNEYKDMDVLVSIEADLGEEEFANSIILSQKHLHFLADEESKLINYKFILPKKMKPGIHEIKLIALELPPEAKPGTYVEAIVAVAHQLRVIVPYPGKYAEVRLDISEADLGEDIIFVITASNLGTETIDVDAQLDILNSEGEIIASQGTDSKTLESMRRSELIVRWSSAQPGEYTAVATLFYDGKSIKTSKEFKTGKRSIVIKRIFVRDFRLRDIAKFAIVVESNWTDSIEDVYAHMKIMTYDNDIIGDMKSASEDVEPFSTKTLYAYWDTLDIDEGDYKGNIIVYYEGETTEKQLKTSVRSDSILVEIIGITGEVIGIGRIGSETTTVLVIFIILLVLANIAWFMYFRKKITRRKRKIFK